MISASTTCGLTPTSIRRFPTVTPARRRRLRIGEYNGISTVQGVTHIAWTGNDVPNAQQDIFYDQFNILGPFADPWEENDSLPNASILGSLPKITIQDATLDNPADVDYYKYTAQDTGKLIVNALFHDGVANLRLRVFDSDGPVDPPIATGTQLQVVPGLDIEGFVIPVVSQEEYWIEVSYDPTELIHNPLVYDLEIENFAAPAPSYIDLTPGSDTGMMNNDDITSDTTPTFLIQADLVDFRNMGIMLLNQAVIDPNNDGDAADATDDGAGVYVSLINLVTGAVVDGFANQVGVSGFLWTFTSAALTAGEYFVSTAVQIVDGQQDPNRENGRAQLSEPLILTIIPTGGNVAAMVSADMVASSDTGMFNNDNVTNKMSPAFNGIAPVGFKVRLYANGDLVGQTVAGSDTSDVGRARSAASAGPRTTGSGCGRSPASRSRTTTTTSRSRSRMRPAMSRSSIRSSIPTCRRSTSSSTRSSRTRRFWTCWTTRAGTTTTTSPRTTRRRCR